MPQRHAFCMTKFKLPVSILTFSSGRKLRLTRKTGQIGGHEGRYHARICSNMIKYSCRHWRSHWARSGVSPHLRLDLKLASNMLPMRVWHEVNNIRFLCLIDDLDWHGQDSCLRGWETNYPGYFAPGKFQKYIVCLAKYVTLIPDGIDLAGATPLMSSGLTEYAALKRASTEIGDWVLVSGGSGGLGYLAI
jgi:hypothetical protein